MGADLLVYLSRHGRIEQPRCVTLVDQALRRYSLSGVGRPCIPSCFCFFVYRLYTGYFQVRRSLFSFAVRFRRQIIDPGVFEGLANLWSVPLTADGEGQATKLRIASFVFVVYLFYWAPTLYAFPVLHLLVLMSLLQAVHGSNVCNHFVSCLRFNSAQQSAILQHMTISEACISRRGLEQSPIQ